MTKGSALAELAARVQAEMEKLGLPQQGRTGAEYLTAEGQAM
jgi:hypothetical protein